MASAKYFPNAAVGMKCRKSQHRAVGSWILPSGLVIFKMMSRRCWGRGEISLSFFICFLVLSQCAKKPWKALGFLVSFFLFPFPSRNSSPEECCKMWLCCGKLYFPPLKIPCVGESSSIRVVLGSCHFRHSETWWQGLHSAAVKLLLVSSVSCRLWKSQCHHS